MTYYCSKCANAQGLRPSAPSTDLLASQYQREKHKKHTIAGSSHPVQTVFDDPSEEYYQQTMLEGYGRGAVQVTSRGTDLPAGGGLDDSGVRPIGRV